jgi:hypothetical protein
MADGISEIFVELMALAERLGVSRINQLPGCWEVQLADGWRAAVNGHGKPMRPSWSPVEIPPMHALIEQPEYFGALALISPTGGVQVGNCEGAIIDAIKRAFPRERSNPPVGGAVGRG